MIIYIYLIVGALVCIFTFLKYHTLFKPNILFSGLWIVGAILVNWNFAGINPIDNRTNFHIILALIAFNLSSLLFYKKEKLKLSKEEIISLLDISKVWKPVLVLNFSMVIFCTPYFFKMLRVMIFDSFYQVRVHAFLYENTYELLCSKIINLPMFALFNLLLIISVLKVVLGEKGNVKLYILMIFDIIFFSIITGSRNYIAKPVFYFVIAYAFIHAVSDVKFRLKMRTIVLGMIVVVILDRMIKARSLSGLSPLENVFVYLFGGIAYYDKIVFSGMFDVENSTMLYGQGTFGWIVSPFLYILSLLKITPDYVAESVIGKVSSQGIYISDTYNFNALTTSLYPMWRDFGVVGIFIGMFVFGMFVSHYKNKLFRHFNQKNLLLFFSFLVAVSECTQYYEPLFIRFSIQILFVVFIWKYNNQKIDPDSNS